ncbi:MAG: hypothetical protein ABI131_11400 [Nostocoides sp.]
MSDAVEVSALAIDVTIPESLRWIDERGGDAFDRPEIEALIETAATRAGVIWANHGGLN